MKIELINKKISQIKADVEIVFAVNKKLKHKWVKDEAAFKYENFKGGEGEAVFLPHKKKLYLGVESQKGDELRRAAAKAIKLLGEKKYKSAKIGLYGEDNMSEGSKALAEGFVLGGYRFDKYKSKKIKQSLLKIIISTESYGNDKIELKIIKEAVDSGRTLAGAVNYTRDIVNQIPAEITPVEMTKIAEQLAKENKLEFKAYGEKYLEKENMGAFLAVSKASPYPPQLIHLSYKGKGAKKKIVLVGKGLTYDSGGLSLKPSSAMVNMKSDKSGACAILGIIKAVSELKIPIEVHGIIGATENIVGKHAFKPDDVVTAKNGKTIEIKNTDAEGRLVLADCLVYGQEMNPDYIIDLATLTGACVVALGEYTIGVMGHNKDLKDSLEESSLRSGELAAELPFNKYLKELLKSEVADISNISSSSYGGAITAALFLSEFIEKKNMDKWVHLDIAGPAFSQKPWGYNPYGGSGAGVRLVVEWINNLLKK